MAISTFQGPVRSLNGFISQGPGTTPALSGSFTLDPVTHGGKTIFYSGTSGTITLPLVNASLDPNQSGPGSDPNTSNNEGVVYTIFVSAATTGTLKIRTTSSTPGDLFVGGLVMALAGGAANLYVPNGSSNDVINLNGTTQGGIAGSYLTIVAIAANRYLVQGVLIGSGTLATPFADT
jgi:hypothetical protein